MFNNVIFLQPYFSKKTWGGNNLSKFNWKLPDDKIGEAWIVSGYPDKSSIIVNEEYYGMTLKNFWDDYRTFFNSYSGENYPLIVKILDCNQDLSVQVHPTTEYANAYHNVKTKNEAWYVLEAKADAQIVYGHRAKSKDEFKNLIASEAWDKLLNTVNVKEGQLFYVPSGTIHALKSGLVIYEVQQNSDTTFRLYDYGREKTDNERKLSVHEAIENTIVPFVKPTNTSIHNELLTTKDFSIFKIENVGTKTYNFENAHWLQCFIYEGEGFLQKTPIKKGTTFLVGNNDLSITLTGNVKLLVSYIVK